MAGGSVRTAAGLFLLRGFRFLELRRQLGIDI